MTYYIHKNKIIKYEEELDPNIYDISSRFTDRFKKPVKLSPEQIEFYEANPEATVSEIWKMELSQPEDLSAAEKARIVKIKQIEAYNESEEVNSFYVNGVPMWLDRDKRAVITNAIQACIDMGREEIRVLNAEPALDFVISPTIAKGIFARIEVYAFECANVTTLHLLQVKQLKTKEEIVAFDITKDYPEKINIEL